jgi:hypothetical protein
MNGEEYGERPDVLAYRVKAQGKSLKELNTWRRVVDRSMIKAERDIVGLEDAFDRVETSLADVQKVLIGLLVAISVSAIGVSFSLLLSAGKL